MKDQSEKLAKLLTWQLLGFVVLEILVGILVLVNIIPAFLQIKAIDGTVVGLNAGFIILVALIVILASSAWLAILVEIFGIMEIKKLK